MVVVIDGQDAEYRLLIESCNPAPPIRWIFHPQNLGLAVARNTGASAAAGDVLLFLDDDTPAHAELVSRHLGHFLQAHLACKLAVYGKIEEDRRAPLPSWTDKFLQQSWEHTLDRIRHTIAAGGEDSIGDEIERAICFGVNCSIRRDSFLRSGGFNPELRDLEEEMEYGHRLYRWGARFVVDPLAIVRHRNPKPMTDYFRRAWYLGGQVSAKRVFDLGQRNPQTSQLVAMHRGPKIRRLLATTAWHNASAMRNLASVLERATNLSGSRRLFGAWARLCQSAEYWSGAKDAGCTLDRLRDIAGTPRCALAMHSLSTPQCSQERGYYLNPQRFRRYIHWLRATGFHAVSASEWFDTPAEQKPVLLTFDDGYDDLYSELLPVVQQFDFKPLVFLVADRIGLTNVWDRTRGIRARHLLTREQIREMQKHGVEFASHSLTHPWLPSLDDRELRREVTDSRLRLEDMLGTPVLTFAYPFGGVDQRVRAAVVDAGYKLAFTTKPGLNWWNDPLCLRRAEVSELDTFPDFVFKLHTGYGMRPWLGAGLRELERGLPTETLRRLIRTARSTAHQTEAAWSTPPPAVR